MSAASAEPATDPGAGDGIDPELLREIESTLRAERRSLLGDVDEVSLDHEDSADDPGALLAARGEISALAQQNADQLSAIDRALERIAEGAYGICASCDEPIPAERLEAVPTAVQCVSCQERGAV
jgi:phage/conjugal plasmid C-4 type zinc finger TraR family protein